MSLPIRLSEENEKYFIEIEKPSLKYINFFLRLHCAPLLVKSRFFPNAKEITETIGVFDTARRSLSLDFQDTKICVVIIGDGHVPRTGFYTALMTSWKVYSVDPAMSENMEKISSALQLSQKSARLTVLPSRIEDCEIDAQDFHTVVLLFVHSHASLKNSLLALKNATNVHCVSLPCCQLDDLGIPPSCEMEDKHILSVERTVKIYKNVITG